MTQEQIAIIRQLRHEGHAVIIWTPEELGDASLSHVEDRLIEVGYEVIEALQND